MSRKKEKLYSSKESSRFLKRYSRSVSSSDDEIRATKLYVKKKNESSRSMVDSVSRNNRYSKGLSRKSSDFSDQHYSRRKRYKESIDRSSSQSDTSEYSSKSRSSSISSRDNSSCRRDRYTTKHEARHRDKNKLRKSSKYEKNNRKPSRSHNRSDYKENKKYTSPSRCSSRQRRASPGRVRFRKPDERTSSKRVDGRSEHRKYSRSYSRHEYRDPRAHYASDSSNDEFDLSYYSSRTHRTAEGYYGRTVKMLRKSGLSFAGREHETALEFLKELRDFIEENDLKEKEIMGNINQVLKEDALVWYRAEKNFSKMDTFAKFARIFKKQFIVTVDDDDIYEELRNRSQGEHESIADYLKACKIIAANFRRPLASKRLVQVVRRHLLVKYQEYLRYNKEIRNLDELRDLCQDYERSIEYEKRYMPPEAAEKMRFPAAAYRELPSGGSTAQHRPSENEEEGESSGFDFSLSSSEA